MHKAVIGILAHVDAGKTTLSEALLYRTGAVRRLGRVDHRDAFLDTDRLERERGITIFSKQAVFPVGEYELTLLDTPGHVDFSAEMERTLQVLDYAILVVSGTDGVQAHTLTVWKLLQRWQVPVFIFVNKTDLLGFDRETRLDELRRLFDENCLPFDRLDTPDGRAALEEAAALSDESAMDEYLDTGSLADGTLRALIAGRRIFPVYFGSALRLTGVDTLLDGLARWMEPPRYPTAFGARVFKVSRDRQGTRLTHLKVTGGSLRVKDLLSNAGPGVPDGEVWQEKADQLRIYSGEKYATVSEVPAGGICAVTGLTRTRPGEGLGIESAGEAPALEPILTCRVLLPDGLDPHTALDKLSQLEEEDPTLHLLWNEALGEIHLQLMGEVQLEVLRELIRERFGFAVAFGPGSIVYKETIAAPVIGIGHYEPLRHYAEVHLLLEPAPRGSGIQLESLCSEDVLDRSWQRLILTHLEEKTHLGVLTGSPLTDVKISLLAGRAHLKHTEGGDFRQATYRAVRQGLKKAESLLLEPYYRYTLEVPAESVGRAMSDLQRLTGSVPAPETKDGAAVFTGRAPAAVLRDYGSEVTSYTQGKGRLTCLPDGYDLCHNSEEVIAASGYDSDRDLENPADSVFCSHGAGVVIPWQEVDARAHVESGLTLGGKEETSAGGSGGSARRYTGSLAEDKELSAIYERTYGQRKERQSGSRRQPDARQEYEARSPRAKLPEGPEYLLVDGYNIIHAWEELAEMARVDFGAARQMLIEILSNYRAYKQCELILVFDAYKVQGSPGSISQFGGIYVVYTKEAETADAYIEKVTLELGKRHRVRVATSDALEQIIILGHGALRVSARAFKLEVEQAEGEIAALIAENNKKGHGFGRIGDRARPAKEDI